YTINEDRPSPADSLGPVTNPYLLSGYVGFDGGGLRIRYAYEMHHDFFGMSQLGGARPSEVVTSSTDVGHQATVQYVLSIGPEVQTRVVGTGELLSYETQDSTPDDINKYSRPAFYALLEQTIFGHHVWVAYGQAFEGVCSRVGGGACSTTGLGAKLGSLGYLYAFNEDTSFYLAGYRIINDLWSRHTPYPPLNSTAVGADVTGVGLGVFYSFGLKASR
ncbi:MAG TPA: hypothetical protein VLA89_11895, partial [Gemmatimonadales bacterium]|nr:hypothetical protein [Gemmatimonadales bacterium]